MQATAPITTTNTLKRREALFAYLFIAPTLIGFLIFVAWFVGWIFLGFHDGLYHVLFPISVVLMVAQGVRRVAR